VSLFNSSLKSTFSLSDGDIGMFYSGATLCSALVLVFLGSLIDRFQLRLYSSLVIAGLAIACFWMSMASTLWMLAIGYFLLRLFGQGLSSHVATTTVSRLGRTNIGKSLSVSGLGFSAGEATLPLLVVFLLGILSWNQVFAVVGLVELVLVLGLANLLIQRSWNLTQADTLHRGAAAGTPSQVSWTRAQFLRDWRIYAIGPSLFAPALFGTALMFHQESMTQTKVFSFQFWSGNLTVYALVSIVSSLAAGELVDRLSGCVVMKVFLLPYVVAYTLLGVLDFPMLPTIFFAILGLTNGIYVPAVSAMWREVYGPQNLGSIRSIVHATMVFSSAIGPTLYGRALDWGVSWNQILILSAMVMFVVSCVMMSVKMQYQPPKNPISA